MHKTRPSLFSTFIKDAANLALNVLFHYIPDNVKPAMPAMYMYIKLTLLLLLLLLYIIIHKGFPSM